jgi:FKBP-type peptidyl-prolyl cis-trans isomerase
MSFSSRIGQFLHTAFTVPVAQNPRRRNRSKHARLFDFLEQRQLFSASLSILGNGVAITNGSTTPSTTTNTDFLSASTTNNSALGYSTRTYIIQNTTASEIDLTGGSNLIQISGADAADFTVTVQPTVAIPAGGLTTFTLQFLPQAAGERIATITIPNNSSDEPAFNFAVQGDGLVTTNASSNLEVATTHAGNGTVAATNGDVLQMTYTGYLLNGTIFDSTANDGGTPFTFRIDDSTGKTYITDDKTGNTSVDNAVIDGWEQGLQGIKAGESRTLIIPSALGYGTAGSGTTIPANATLIFDVTANSLGYSPELGVQGNSTDILPGDTTPSTTDGTDFGNLSGGQTSVSHTFNLYDYSEADSANGTLIDGLSVTGGNITGTGAKNFTLTGGANGTFTITYKPTAIGTANATINLYSNDAGNPDYTFAVTGANPAYADLTVAVGATKFPASVVAGDGTTLTLPVTIKNQGNSPIAKNAVASVQVYLKDTTTGNQTLLTAPISSINLSSLAGGKTKSFSETVTVPAGTTADTYELLVAVNATGAVAESDTTNDTATTAHTFAVATGFYDLSGALVSSKLPTTVVAGQSVSGSFSLSVKNASNIVLPKGQSVTVTVLAHNLNTGVDTTIFTTHESLSAVKAGIAHTYALSVKDTAGLAAGSYQYEALLTPSPALMESNTVNNTLTTTAAGLAFDVTANPAVNNLTGTLVKSTLKAGAALLAGTVAVKIQSTGNVNLPATQQFQLLIYAHPAGAIDNSTDILLQTSAAFSVKNWKPNQSASFSVPVKFAGTLTTGSYAIEAKIVPVQSLTESSTADNLITETAAGQLLTLGIA